MKKNYGMDNGLMGVNVNLKERRGKRVEVNDRNIHYLHTSPGNIYYIYYILFSISISISCSSVLHCDTLVLGHFTPP